MAAPLLARDDIEIIAPDHFVAHGYPHDAYALLRREDPVHWFVKNDVMPFWAITKHADIVHIGKHPETFVSGPDLVIRTRAVPEGDAFEPPPTLIQLDPPVHGKYRKIVSKRFTPGALRRMHGEIESIAKEIVDSLLEEGDEGSCDFVEKVAAPLPIAVIAWLLGVPKSDWNLLFDWTNRTIGADDPEYQVEGRSSIETMRGAGREMFEYFSEMTEGRRKHPRDDLVSILAHAAIDGEPLPTYELLSYYFLLVLAGNETTRNATTGGLLALIENPEQLDRVRRDPSLVKPLVEEILRWTSPVIHFCRTPVEDFEMHGEKIRAGESLCLFYPSANRDERVFDAPDEFRVDRRPNRHIAFGIGEHVCLGAHVARLELQVIFRHLTARIEEVELAGPIERLRSNIVGGIKHMPIRYRLGPTRGTVSE